jgi:UDPglucose 6-dehydrogenase
MDIAIIGAGCVGLTTAAAMLEAGHSVVCIDKDADKIARLKRGEETIYEACLMPLLRRKNAEFDSPEALYAGFDAVFICTGTPPLESGDADTRSVLSAVQNAAAAVKRECVLAIRSTVPPDIFTQLDALAGSKLHIAAVPEFLSQGSAVYDALHPSRIVLGVSDAFSEQTLRAAFKPFDVPMLVTGRCEAMFIKYASNAFLALKVSFINEIAALCGALDADITDVTLGMGLDSRIGNEFLKPGIGWGGSCFSKDIGALSVLSARAGITLETILAAVRANKHARRYILQKAHDYYGSFDGLIFAVLGMTFKAGTGDLRDSPALENIALLEQSGATLRIWDQALRPEPDIPALLEGAHGCFIFTDWPRVSKLQSADFLKMKRPVVFDGRNCLDMSNIDGVTYYGVGRQRL